MSKSGDSEALPLGCGTIRGNLFALPLLYGYEAAVWIALGSAPVGVGPGKPTTDSGGKFDGLTAAAYDY
jgi:hypothetical protein